MSGRRKRMMCLLGALAFCLLGSPVLADDDPAAPAQGDGVARLQALLEAQQSKIEALEQQVAAAAQQDVNQEARRR